MPLFVGHLLMWPLKSGRLHIVLCLLISCYLAVYPSLILTTKTLNISEIFTGSCSQYTAQISSYKPVANLAVYEKAVYCVEGQLYNKLP
jgi:hypothetical protein